MTEGAISVILADDNLIVREGVRALIERHKDLRIVGVASDYDEVVQGATSLEPQVLVTDIRMPPAFNREGIDAAKEVRKRHPGTGVVILSQYDDPEYVSRFLKAGVAGYVLKKAAGPELAAAIRNVYRGGLVLDPAVARDALAGPPAGAPGAAEGDPYEALTDREKQVLKLVAEGRSNKEVAQELAISVKTAMSHRENIMEKLGLHSRTDLIRFALKKGVIRV